MMERRDVWIRITTFVGVTYVWSWIFMAMAISAGKITVAAALGGMWSPFVGLLVTRALFPDGRRRGSLYGLGWKWGKTRWQLLSYFLPILYVGAAHGAAWIFGMAGFTDASAGEIALQTLKAIALGTVFGSIFAFGEEIGWQGYLVPKLYRITGFTKTSFCRGIIWSVWHYPLIIGGVYGTTETPLWFRLICFTVTMTAVSFAFSWLRIKSGSLWTGVFLHAMHNLYIQEIFPSLTVNLRSTLYLTDEFGAFSAAAAVLIALFFWVKRSSLLTTREVTIDIVVGSGS
jgi:membrane protease YdiL (CAAX protease family)